MEGTGGECAEELSKTIGPVALSVLVASNELHSTKLGVMTDAFWQPGELMKACHQVQVGTPLIMDSAELQKVPPPHFAFVWARSFFIGRGEGQLEKCTKERNSERIITVQTHAHKEAKTRLITGLFIDCYQLYAPFDKGSFIGEM
jgi:hypothetical protein